MFLKNRRASNETLPPALATLYTRCQLLSSISIYGLRRLRMRHEKPRVFIRRVSQTMLVHWQTCCMLNGSRSVPLMVSIPVVTSQWTAFIGGVVMPITSVGHLNVRT